MRVAIVVNTSWNIYNYRKGLLDALLKKGNEVVAIAPADTFSEKLKELGCVYLPLEMDNKGTNPLKDILLILKFYFVYRKIRPDFILHYTIKPNVYGTLAAWLLGIPCISNVSGLGTTFIRKGFVHQIVKLLYKFAFKFPQKVFFQNLDDQRLFLDLGLVKEEKTGLVPGSGINLNSYRPLEYRKREVFCFLLIARLLKDKGIVEFAMASKYLKEKGYQFKSILVGFFDRQSIYNVDEEDIMEWDRLGYLKFLGESKHVEEHIAIADCVVLPSYREGTPRSLLEAMALAKPIITTDVPGCREVIVDGENGYSCMAKDSKSLASAMERMMCLNENELKEMGLKGRRLAEQKFDERIVIDKYLEEMFGNYVSN